MGYTSDWNALHNKMTRKSNVATQQFIFCAFIS